MIIAAAMWWQSAKFGPKVWYIFLPTRLILYLILQSSPAFGTEKDPSHSSMSIPVPMITIKFWSYNTSVMQTQNIQHWKHSFVSTIQMLIHLAGVGRYQLYIQSWVIVAPYLQASGGRWCIFQIQFNANSSQSHLYITLHYILPEQCQKIWTCDTFWIIIVYSTHFPSNSKLRKLAP